MTTLALDPEPLAFALAPAFAGAVEGPSPALLDAWRQAHHAAQLASEVGKGWALPRDDDSHSSFAWRAGALHGVPVSVPIPFHATLRVASLELAFLDERDAPIATRGLAGSTLAEGMAWTRAQAERLAGPARQPARPAPDLPRHPVAEGGRFGAGAGLPALARLLEQSDTVLGRIVALLPAATAPRCWPHHFDLATLVPLASAPDGTVTASLGLGLAVPDAFAAGGYWYASPWRAAPPARRVVWPALPAGHWAPRGAGPPLGVLPLAALAALAPRAAAEAVAAFVAAALRASLGFSAES